MRGKTYLILTILLMISSITFAKEVLAPQEITKIERVRWSGLSLGIGWKEWRILGSWATVPRETTFTLFGATSPYFRLNGDDRAVFRGLGRESDFVQWLFPTLRSRKKLRDILKVTDKAIQSLEKYDSQIITGERIHMGATALTAIGNVGIVTGFVIMIVGFYAALESPEEEPTIAKAGYRIGVASVLIWGIGRMGQLVSEIVTSRAFSHLHDALDYFNAEKAGKSKKISGDSPPP